MGNGRGVVGNLCFGGFGATGVVSSGSCTGSVVEVVGYCGEKRSNAVGVWGMSRACEFSCGEDPMDGSRAVRNVPEVGENWIRDSGSS